MRTPETVVDSKHSQRQTAFQDHVDRHHGHNFLVNLAEGSLFQFGMTLLNAATVLSAFLMSMGASKIVIGLVPSLFTFFWTVPQILSAYRLGHLSKKRHILMIRRFISGVPWFILAAILVFYRGTPAWQNASIIALIATIIIFSLLGGHTVPLWVDFIGKIFRPDSRGRFYGWRSVLGAILGLAGSFAVALLLDPKRVAFPYGYAWMFAAAGVCFCVGALFLGRSREVAPPEPLPDARKHGFLEELAATWRSSRAYRFFVIAVVVSAFGGGGMGGVMAWPFYMVRAQEVLGASGAFVGRATACLILGRVITAFIGGRVVDRMGARISFLIAMAISVAVPILGLVVNSQMHYLGVFLMMGATRGFIVVSYHNSILDVVPVDLRARAIGLANFIRSPVCLVAAPIGGVILVSAGYAALFLTASVASAFGLVLLILSMKREGH